MHQALHYNYLFIKHFNSALKILLIFILHYKIYLYMHCICINSAGLEAKQGHKVKFKVLTPLNFLALPSFSVASPSCKPVLERPRAQPSHTTVINKRLLMHSHGTLLTVRKSFKKLYQSLCKSSAHAVNRARSAQGGLSLKLKALLKAPLEA